MSMLFKIDTIYGHVMEDTPEGPVYQDDRTPVRADSLRPCLGCGVQVAEGTHDPCIANLPETLHACCGHGRDCTPVSGNPSGYAALKDGRRISFSGLCGGKRIRAAVDALIKGEPLPEGFTLDEETMWWAGLTAVQRKYVEAIIPRGLAELVVEAKNGEQPSERFLRGDTMWWDGLTEQQKAYVWSRLNAKIAEHVQEALQNAA